MNYIGSKHTLSNFIIDTIEDVSGDLKDKVFCDIFAGTGIIPRKVKMKVKQIIANDFEHYSYVLLRNYIGNHKPINYEPLLDSLNKLPGIEGKIYKNYCAGSGSERNYFSDENGQKIDAIRNDINRMFSSSEISDDEYYFLLASLIESADKVANTASVYGAFLKHIKKSAEKPLVLEPALFECNDTEHKVYCRDSNELIEEIEGDVLYLDPPYNHRQYGANYHMLNTIAKYDDFEPKGKTGLRPYLKSDYCVKRKVVSTFRDLISKANFKHIFLSYNNEGLMTFEEIREIMREYGKYDLIQKVGYQRFKADRDENRTYKASKTIEFVHILEKN